jgi:WD40 repeat protein
MIDAQTTRPIQCECCGFVFKFAASEHSTKVSCPACGGENLLTHCQHVSCTEKFPVNSSEISSEISLEISPEVLPEIHSQKIDTKSGITLPQISVVDLNADELQRCRAKNCPRMKYHHGGGCSHQQHSCTAAKKSGDDWDYQQWITLLLTVCIQIIVLFGSGIFILSNNEKNTQADGSLAQVTVNKNPDWQQLFPTTSTASSQKTTKPEIVNPKPPVAGLVKEPIFPETNKPNSQKPKEKIATNQLPQTKSAENNPLIQSPFLIQPVIPSTVTTKELVTPEFAAAETATPQLPTKTETKSSSLQNEKDKFEKDKPETVNPELLSHGIAPPVKSMEKPKVALKKENATNKSLPEVVRLAAAEVLLEESLTSLMSNPEQSLKDVLDSVKTFEEFGRSLPSTAYWILGQAHASLSWGKMFLTNIPSIENMVVSSDSHWLLTQCQDNSVWLWDLFHDPNNRSGIKLDSGKTPYVKLLFSPDLRLIIGGRADGSVLVWDMARPNPAEVPVLLKEKVIGLRDLQISPDGCWLAAFGGAMRSSLEVVRNNRYVDSVGATVQIETAFGGNENYFCNLNKPFSPSQSVRLHSAIPLPEIVSTIPMFSGEIPADEEPANELPVKMAKWSSLGEQPFLTRKNVQVSFLSEYSTIQAEKSLPKTADDSETATALLEPNVVWLWDLRQISNGFISPPIVLRGQKQEIRLIQFSNDSSKLAVGGKDSTTLIYDLREGKTERVPLVLRGHHLDVTAIAFAPNNSWVATGSRDNTVRLWNLTGSKPLPDSVVLNGHLGWISSLAVDQSGTQLFSGSYDKTIRIWRLDRNDIRTAVEREPLVLQSNQGVIRELALSPDGKKLISLGGDNSLRIRNIDGTIDDRHSVVLRNRMLPISKMGLTPDNRWLVFGYTNQKNPANSGIRLWPLNIKHLVQIASENE